MSRGDEREYQTVILGALLHDVGKAIQRAQQNPSDKTHGQWGYEWLRSQECFKNDPAVNAAISHHKDDDVVFESNYGLIWYQADNLASSERQEEKGKEKGKWEMFTPLASPFFKVRNPETHLPLDKIPYLNLRREIKGIETSIPDKPEITQKDYEELVTELEKDLKSIKTLSVNSLLILFEKHLSNVPSITREIYSGKEENIYKHPDISLFNHLKLTAAIAGCMYHYYRETCPVKWNNNELLKDEILQPDGNEKPYLLIGGDISGVQKFIYTITSKGALKSLKGRSFYLELLAEHIISELLKALNLTRCNLIFSGGGHFYIISHNTPSARDVISTIKKKIDDFLFDEFKGNLQLHLAPTPFAPDGFKNTTKVWAELSQSIEEFKKRKWKDRLSDILAVQSQHDDCLTQSCKICFREDLPLKELIKDDETVRVCEPCHAQYRLGEMLKSISQSDFPLIYKFKESPDGDAIKIEDSYYQLKGGWDESLHKEAETVYRINDLRAKHYEHENSVYLPIGIYQHENIRDLSDMVSVYGINRIAVLRMDVDNLGRIFSEAVLKEDRTFSRIASISKGLNDFFKYYLNKIVEGKDIEPCDIADRGVMTKGKRLSIVYSGGDDLFLIGHWLDVIEAAYDIKYYFVQYTGNKYMTISGGIAVNHEHYPVYQYAKDAEEAEKKAKSKEVGKNALTLFDEPLKWDVLDKVIERVKLFKGFLKPQEDCLAVDEEKLPKTFFYRLLALARRFKEDRVLILPKAAWLISRARFKESNQEDVLKIKEVIMNGNKDEWLITETATLITLMMMRKGGDENV